MNLMYLRPGAVGGSEVYVRGLAKALAAHVGVPLTAFCSSVMAQTLDATSGLAPVVLASGNMSPGKRLFAENWTLSRELARNRIDVLLSPGNFGPVLLPSTVPQVATVHDLQHARWAKNFSVTKRYARSALFRGTAWRSRKIIAISDFTRSELVDVYSLPEDQVIAVDNGFDAPERPGRDAITAVRARYGLPDAYAIFPAMVAPHKNHHLLLRVLERLRASGQHIPLVFIGSRRERYAAIQKEAADRHVAGALHVLGFVDRAEVFPLIAGARVLLYPSMYEGFGLPLLEAMHLQVPVVSSDAACLPAIAGQAALLAPPTDVEAWCEALVRIWSDESLRAHLIALGRLNVDRFSWNRCARETLRVLECATSAS